MPDYDLKPMRIGINLGYNQSHFNFLHHQPTFLGQDSVMVVNSTNNHGLNLGVNFTFRLNDHFSFRTYPINIVFTEKNFEYNLKYPDKPAGEDSITKKKVNSISLVPAVQLKFASDRINNFKVFMIGGAKLEYDMAANAGARKAENLIKLKKFDLGLEAGIGFHIYFPMFVLSPELKVGWGLGNLHARDKSLKFSNVIDKVNSRSITFSLTVE
ncbi:MAG: PorT family protein [Ferruginibacter sp.]|nr:PorT family protein [Ferruginibacter sp.]